MANPPPLRLVGGCTGKEPLGAGSTIGQGAAGQLPLMAALVVGIVFKAVRRAEVSTLWIPAGFVIEVVKPKDPFLSKLLVMPSPKWS